MNSVNTTDQNGPEINGLHSPESMALQRQLKRLTYRRDWMRKRRAEKGVRVSTLLTTRLAERAKAAKPPSFSWEQWWAHLIRRGLARPEQPVAIPPVQPVQAPNVPRRNATCACGSGRKFKRCCGKA